VISEEENRRTAAAPPPIFIFDIFILFLYYFPQKNPEQQKLFGALGLRGSTRIYISLVQRTKVFVIEPWVVHRQCRHERLSAPFAVAKVGRFSLWGGGLPCLSLGFGRSSAVGFLFLLRGRIYYLTPSKIASIQRGDKHLSRCDVGGGGNIIKVAHT
jgi:hypothetical protein